MRRGMRERWQEGGSDIPCRPLFMSTGMCTVVVADRRSIHLLGLPTPFGRNKRSLVNFLSPPSLLRVYLSATPRDPGPLRTPTAEPNRLRPCLGTGTSTG